MTPFKHFLLFLLFLTIHIPFSSGQTILCPPNIDFEMGNLTGWKLYAGYCCPINTSQVFAPIPGGHTITNGTGVDLYGGFPVVSPNGGNYSLRVGNAFGGSNAERATYTINVPAGGAKYILVFRYAVVLEDPKHDPSQQPRFEIKVYDAGNNTVDVCGNFKYVAGALPGFEESTVKDSVYYKEWSTATINLSQYSGKSVTVDVASGDCGLNAHFGYGYVDMGCGLFKTLIPSCDTQATVNLSAGKGYQDYRWYDKNFTTVVAYGDNVNIPRPAVSTEYALVLTPYPGFGCPDTLYTTVLVSDTKLTPSEGKTVCGVNPFPLNIAASGSHAPFTYQWEPAGKVDCHTCPSPNASLVSGDNIFKVTVIDSLGCPADTFIKVKVVDSLNASLGSIKDPICQYETIEIKDTVASTIALSHSWNVDTGVILKNEHSKITVTWVTPGLKRIVMVVTNGVCHSFDTAYVNVKPGPRAYFDMLQHACLGDTVQIKPLEQDAAYSWALNDGNIPYTDHVPVIYRQWHSTGQKILNLSVTGPNGCRHSFTDTILIHEYPPAYIKHDNSEICLGDTMKLSTTECRNCNYAWVPVTSYVFNNHYTVPYIVEKNSNYVSLYVTNEWGCTTGDSTFFAAYPCCDIFFPDAFSPNGDGFNDRFHVLSGGHQQIQAFYIVNRWGQILYNSTDQYSGWDGTFKGVKQDMATYYYYIEYLCEGNKKYSKKGNFTLIR